MTDHNLDPNLMAQLEALRAQLTERLQTSEDPRVLELIQALNRLVVDLHGGQLRSEEAGAELNSIAARADALGEVESDEGDHLSLIQETLPKSAQAGRQADNQARLVERLLDQGGLEDAQVLDAVQRAIGQLMTLRRQAPPAAAKATPGQLQAKLSAQLDASISARVESRLMRRDELDGLRRAAAEQQDLDAVGGVAVPSSGDLQSDLLSIIQRLEARDASGQLAADDMVLARVESDAEGKVKRVALHNLRKDAGAPPPLAATDGPRDAVSEAFAREAVRARAQARFDAMVAEHAASAERSEEARAEVEAARARVEALSGQALAAQSALQSAHQESKQRAQVERLVAEHRAAARSLLRQQQQSMLMSASDYAALLKQQAERSGGAQREAFKGEAGRLDGIVEQLASAGLGADQLLSAGRALQVSLRAASDHATTDAFDALFAQVEAASSRAEQAVAAVAYTPIPDAAEAQPEAASAREAEVAEASARLQWYTSRFEQSQYQSAALHEQIHVVEAPLETFGVDVRRGQRAAQASRPNAQPQVGPAPSVRVSPGYAHIALETESSIQRLRGLESTHAAPSVDLYADTAGLEVARSASQALSVGGDQSAASAALFEQVVGRALGRLGDLNRQAAALAQSAASLTASRSGQRDLGMPTVERYEMDPGAASPLFKRKIGVSHEGRIGGLYMPALHEVSGLSRHDGAGAQAQYDVGGEDLEFARLGVEAREIRRAQGQVLGALQRLFGANAAADAAAPMSATLARLESWSDAQLERTTARRESAVAEDSGLEVDGLVKELRGEAGSVPFDVAEKLRPMLQLDLDDVKVYTGSRAAEIADAMGAHAFTLGKHIFGRIDFSTVEGLSLFAHEAVHTGHFHDSSSVEQKEAEAEAMERRVMSSLSEGRKELALDLPTTYQNDGVLRSSGHRTAVAGSPPEGSGEASGGGSEKALFDALKSEQGLQQLAKIIGKFMSDEMQREIERRGQR